MRSLVFLTLFLFNCIGLMAQIESPSEISAEGKNRLNELFSGKFAQPQPGETISLKDQMKANEMNAYLQAATFTTTSTVGDDYDVVYYRLNLRVNPDSAKYVKGSMTNYFKTTIPNFSLLKYDFVSNLICDSVYYHGLKLAASKFFENGDVLEITLGAITAAGTLDSVTVYYKGVPAVVPGFSNGTGYVKSTHNTTQNYIYTLSEPYSSYTWWPCKSFIANDKADSLDIYLSTPVGFRTAANGIRVSETTVGPNVLTYWKHRYPISSYQVCLGVANYVQYPTTPDIVNIGGTPMQYYNLIFPEGNTATSQGQLDKTKLMLTTFSSKFGDYPFKNEKYGNYSFGFGGGMEHNTFSGMNPSTYNSASAWDINAHELGHQWWGASVTCGSWRDIWVNESFATYSEIVCAEFAPSVCSGWTGVSWRQNVKATAINSSNQLRPIYVSDTTSIITIFTPAVYIYERGAMVISMLRTLLGDTKFFQALKNYQSDPLLKYGNGKTDDVKRHMEAVSGINLTTFFNQWIYNTGYANYNNTKWNNAGKRIQFQFNQTVSNTALTHFDMPVAVRVQGAGGEDTLITMYDQNRIMYNTSNGNLSGMGTDMLLYTLSFVPTTVTFDPYSQVLANGTMVKNAGMTVLATNLLSFNGAKQPEGVKLWWTVEKSHDYSQFQIERSSDGVNFSKIEAYFSTDHPGQTAFQYTDQNFFNGTSYYRIKIVEKDGSAIYTKTIVIASTTNSQGAFSISPVPANKFINIRSKSNGIYVDIRFINAEGVEVKKLVKKNFSANNTLRISLDELASGNYFVELRTGENQVETQKIVVIR